MKDVEDHHSPKPLPLDRISLRMLRAVHRHVTARHLSTATVACVDGADH
jgi:hypothetical protein